MVWRAFEIVAHFKKSKEEVLQTQKTINKSVMSPIINKQNRGH